MMVDYPCFDYIKNHAAHMWSIQNKNTVFFSEIFMKLFCLIQRLLAICVEYTQMSGEKDVSPLSAYTLLFLEVI